MKIVVLAGGTSTEREVSIVSGTGICQALREKGHQSILVDVFFGLPEVDGENLFPEEYDIEAAAQAMRENSKDVEKVLEERKSFWGPHVLELCDAADLVFLALHGMNGEDGRVQATFDLMGIRYTGAGYLSSGLAMDKSLTKQFFHMNGIPTPRGITLDVNSTIVAPRQLGLSFPLVVKTCCGGSSVGVFIVRDERDYTNALKEAFALEEMVIVEEFIEGRELTAAVVDGKAYPVVEIAPVTGFYDYKNKYEPGATVETCPAKITPEETRLVQELSVRAARALGIEEYCRMDFILRPDGEVFCLEINTLPGMTPTSLIPQEARVLGMEYPDLCEELIRVSLAKYGVDYVRR